MFYKPKGGHVLNVKVRFEKILLIFIHLKKFIENI